MIRNVLTFSVVVVAVAAMASPVAQAQCSDCGGVVSGRTIGSRVMGARAGIGSRLGGILNRGGGAYSYDQDGMTQPMTEFVGPRATITNAIKDNYTPNRPYAYSNAGLDAANTQAYNNSQQDVYAWHGAYKNWRWGTPTALVVPPTASYHTSYAWGVGQTRSTPIHHQFGRGTGTSIGGGTGAGFSNTPYWPHSTDNFGINPVRGPW